MFLDVKIVNLMFQPCPLFRLCALQSAHWPSRAMLPRLSFLADVPQNDSEREARVKDGKPI